MQRKKKVNKPSKLHKMQLEILQLFSTRKFTRQELLDIKKMISNYCADKAQTGLDQFIEEQQWTQEDIDRMANEHIRTPYNQ